MQSRKIQQNMVNSNKSDACYSLLITVLVLLPPFPRIQKKYTRRTLCRFTVSQPIVSNKSPTNLVTIRQDWVYNLSINSVASNTYYPSKNPCNNIISKILFKISYLNNLEFSRITRHPEKTIFSKILVLIFFFLNKRF